MCLVTLHGTYPRNLKKFRSVRLVGNITTFKDISDGKLHNVNSFDIFPVDPGAYHIMDREQVDFTRLCAMTKIGAFFIARAKSNIQCNKSSSFIISNSKEVQNEHNSEC